MSAAWVCVGNSAGSGVAVSLGTGVEGEKGVKVGNSVGVTSKIEEDGSPPLPTPTGMARTHAVKRVVISTKNTNRRSTDISRERIAPIIT
jgi:hypothetical protein